MDIKFKELVLEIGTEEIPSRFLFPALESLKENANSVFKSNDIEVGKVEAYGTPRRMVLFVNELGVGQPDKYITVFGPPKKVAYGSDGLPSKAALGFARKESVDVDSLKIEKNAKGEYLAVQKKIIGKETHKILPRALLEIIKKIYFPKNMRFESTGCRFVRPIRWISAVFDGKIVSFELAGVKSGNKSRGHRFMSPDEFTFNSFDEFKKRLSSAFVILDPSQRREIIVEGARKKAKELGGHLFLDNELLEEVTNLVEYPVVLVGDFDKKFLSLPREVLMTSMKKHQKYFSILDSDKNTLLPNFITVSNIGTGDTDTIKNGNERVLRARLTDALFFFSEDKKIKLSSRVDSLKNVVYQARLGSVHDKALRVEELSEKIINEFHKGNELEELLETTKRAAQICKCDLVSGMVGEFPELQGVMGKVYAADSGESEGVSHAIFEHYLPRFPGDIIPNSLPGIFLSIADRLDSITGCFGIDKIPTGTKDPNGLRRAGLGIVSTLVGNRIHINLSSAVSMSVKIQGSSESVVGKVNVFLKQRIEHFFTEKGFGFDLIDAVLSVSGKDPFDALLRLEALAEFQKGESFNALAVSFKRVGNIIPPDFKGEVNPELFKEEVEKTLFNKSKEIISGYSSDLRAENYRSALERVSHLRNAVDDFFSGVMVMDKDEEVRKNRLGLLYWINGIFLEFADFSKLVI